MKNELLIEDLFEGEDDALGRGLFGALGELRADPEDFAEGVAKRIRERGEEAPSEAGEGTEAQEDLEDTVPNFVRRAAAFLPPVLLPKSLAKLGVGGAMASKASIKFLPGVLALPIISLVMIFVTLVVGIKSALAGVGVATRENAAWRNQADAKYEVAMWWRRFWLPVGACLALGLYWIFRSPGEGFALMFLGSTLTFLGVHAALARRGLATRREVGRVAGAALGWLVGGSFWLSSSDPSWVGHHVGGKFVPVVLMVGVFLCMVLVRKDAPKHEQKAFGIRIGVFVVVAVLIGGFLLLGPFEQVRETPATLRDWIEKGADPDSIKSLEETIVCLKMAGEGDCDLTRLREKLQARIDEDVAGRGFSSVYAGAMIRLGAFRDEDFDRVRDEDAVERTLTWQRDGIDAESSMPELLAHQERTPFIKDERDVIVAGVLAWLDPEAEYANVENAISAVRLFESIGAEEAVPLVAADAKRILERTWTLNKSGKSGAFTSYPAELREDKIRGTLYFGQCYDTAIAIELMARFGVPAGIDLDALDSFLAEESYHFPDMSRSYAANAAAGRALLHTLPEWRQVDHSESPLEVLIGMRVLLAALLLSGFAVLLTYRAPVQIEKRRSR